MKIADTPPVYCVSCHKAGPEEGEFVDFEAYYDGPVVEEEHYKFQIDDLIMCTDCVTEAAKLIGLGSRDDLENENRELGEAFDIIKSEKDSLAKVISDQQDLITSLGSDKIVKVIPKQPKIVEKV